MRILFDGFWWVRGPVSNRQVMREFILAWEREFPGDELIVAVPGADVGIARGQLPPRVELVGTRLRPQGVSAILELPFLARRLGVDLTLAHNFTPLFGRSAVFVHDLMFVTNPEWFTTKERAYFALMTLTLGRARWVLTSSRSEAARITRVARSHPRVSPVGLGMSRALSAAVASRPPGLDYVQDFLLSVGRLNARKNLGSAIEAAIASGVVSPATPLLIVGEPGGKSATLAASVAGAVESGAVRFLGFVDDDGLAWLYENARVFLFFSLDEGFGMPTLEAVQFGTPVVASDIAVFREILGSRARYVAPHDVEAGALAIRSAFDAGRAAPIDVEQLGYSWELSAQRIREAISAESRVE
jgi:glycosyltransferase involved in cell wall biosynthesis